MESQANMSLVFEKKEKILSNSSSKAKIGIKFPNKKN